MNIMNYKSSEILKPILFLNAFVIIIFLAYFGKLLFIPLFFSFLLALFLHPLCIWFEAHRLNRLISSILCVFLLLLFCIAIAYFLSSQAKHFIGELPSLKDKLDKLMQNVHEWLQQHYNVDDTRQTNYLDNLMDDMIKSGKSVLFTGLFVLVEGTLSLFFTFYMLLYRKPLKIFVLSLFSRQNRKNIFEILETLHVTIINYIKGLLTEIAILISLSCITLFILGVKYAILMAFFAGLLNIIPYIGIYVAIFINVLITITTGNESQSVEVLLVFVIIHIIDSNLIVPLIVGRRIKINPLATLIAVVAGELIWGIPGMFLFIPLTAILNVIFSKTFNAEAKLVNGGSP